MRRLIHKLAILVLAVGLTASGVPTHGFANPAPAKSAAAATHEAHDHHASPQSHHSDCHDGDLAGASAGHSHDDDLCKKCCGVCITASVIPAVAAPSVPAIALRQSFWNRTSALVAHPAPSEPGIPKPLT